MPNKYRKGGVKAEHTILSGIGSLLQMVASCPYVHAVTPGRISRSPMGPSRPQLVFQYFQHTGLKLIGKTSTAVQEVFVVSSQRQEAYDWLVSHKVISPPVDDKPQPRSKDARLAKKKSKLPEVYELTEASEMTLQRYLERLRVESSEKLSPLTEEQKKQLRQLRQKLEEAEKQKKSSEQRKIESQGQIGRGHNENQAHKKVRSQAQRTSRAGTPKTRDQKNSPPETLEDWLEETAGLSEEHWEQLLRHFGQKDD